MNIEHVEELIIGLRAPNCTQCYIAMYMQVCRSEIAYIKQPSSYNKVMVVYALFGYIYAVAPHMHDALLVDFTLYNTHVVNIFLNEPHRDISPHLHSPSHSTYPSDSLGQRG